MTTTRLFTYGTLMRRGRLEALTSARLPAPRPAVLEGYRKYDTGQGYPIILPESGHRVEGLLWEVEEQTLGYIDHYEGVDEEPPFYFRRQVEVDAGGERTSAWVYVGNPDAFPDRRPLD